MSTVPPPYVPPPPMSPAQPVPGQAPPAKSGCGKIACIGCSVLAVLGAIAAFCLVFFVFRVIKSSDVYTEAANRATHDPRVIAVLGEPIETGFWVGGSVKIDNDHGTANINFPISGPKGKARVHARANNDGHGWQYEVLRVQPSQGPPIDLAP
jgi:hypothetical protein